MWDSPGTATSQLGSGFSFNERHSASSGGVEHMAFAKMKRAILISTSSFLVFGLAACGDPGSSGTSAPQEPNATTGEVCEPVAGEDLVSLDDDQGLQTVDNIIAAVNADAADPALMAAVDLVAESLDTAALIDLNRAVDVERNTSSQAAAAFVAEHDLTAPEQAPDARSVVVGAANFSESATLAELYAAVLKDAGYDVEVRTIGNRELYLPALESGELTIVPEYVGTLTEYLNLDQNGSDADPVASSDLEDTMEHLTELAENAGLAVGSASDAADQNSFAVTAEFAAEHNIATLSDLSEACGGVILGGPPECPERGFCQPGLEEVYGLTITDFRSLDAGGPLTKAALRNGEVSIGMILSSDPDLVTD